MKKVRFILLFLFLGITSTHAADRAFELQSPDGKLKVTVRIGKEVSYELSHTGILLIKNSPISMTLLDGKTLGNKSTFQSQATFGYERYTRPIYGFQGSISERYKELTISFKEDFSLVFRAYNEGMAYRFVTRLPAGILVENEEASFNFVQNHNAYFHESGLMTSFESDYTKMRLTEFKEQAMLPLVVELPEGKKAIIMESDLLDYPGMHLSADSTGKLHGIFARHPQTVEKELKKGFELIVKERHNFIAQTVGTRFFPWRIVGISNNDKELLNNQLVYLLATDNKLRDVSWIKPGKVAWDWWNSNTLEGVPFKAGVNTETYKYYIDFAAENNLEYVILDEGWSDTQDLLKPTKDVDMKELTQYARSKKVGLILWCVWHVLDRQMTEALEQFDQWGIAGIKVDFMNRDDQVVVNFYERTLQEAAKRRLLVDFHGAFKPTGLERTYPNQINREGVKGLEWNKFDKVGISPEHDVTIPFIRMAAGAMDYTPGAMTNANIDNWRMIFERPMSQGTRCHQLAMYVVYYAPLQMLADSPTSYEREQECTDFISEIPTVWDETVPLDSQLGDYVTIARRKGATWYLASMTDWDARNLEISLDFLDAGEYEIEIFADGLNSNRIGSDYKKSRRKISKDEKLNIEMAGGGGWIAKLKRL